MFFAIIKIFLGEKNENINMTCNECTFTDIQPQFVCPTIVSSLKRLAENSEKIIYLKKTN
jgi:hypothetical protein